jgi:hypothetical protein
MTVGDQISEAHQAMNILFNVQGPQGSQTTRRQIAIQRTQNFILGVINNA